MAYGNRLVLYDRAFPKQLPLLTTMGFPPRVDLPSNESTIPATSHRVSAGRTLFAFAVGFCVTLLIGVFVLSALDRYLVRVQSEALQEEIGSGLQEIRNRIRNHHFVMLMELGIVRELLESRLHAQDGKIVFFPSWESDLKQLSKSTRLRGQIAIAVDDEPALTLESPEFSIQAQNDPTGMPAIEVERLGPPTRGTLDALIAEVEGKPSGASILSGIQVMEIDGQPMPVITGVMNLRVPGSEQVVRVLIIHAMARLFASIEELEKNSVTTFRMIDHEGNVVWNFSSDRLLPAGYPTDVENQAVIQRTFEKAITGDGIISISGIGPQSVLYPPGDLTVANAGGVAGNHVIAWMPTEAVQSKIAEARNWLLLGGSGITLAFALAAGTMGALWSRSRQMAAGLRIRTEELHRALKHAEAANQAKSSFLAVMSHEIRTPMNGLLGFTDLLLDSPLQETQREHLQTIRSSGNALLHIVNDILDLSSIEAGALRLRDEWFAPEELVQEVVHLFDAPPDQKKSVVYHGGECLPARVCGDAGRLRQILVNLIGNAVKFGAGMPVECSLACSLESQPDASDSSVWLLFRVRDEGPGISPEDAHKIFEPFTQADDPMTRRHAGAGLGLTIARKLAAAMGGHLELESTGPKGSTFLASLPFATVEDGISQQLPEESAVPPATTFAGRRALIVDDDPVNRKLLSLLLTKMQVSHDCAEDGLRAVECCAQERFDIVFMDLQMPGIDGVEAMRRIRKAESTSGQRVFLCALTANAQAKDRKVSMEAGADEFLSKPYRREDLARVLERLATH